MAAMRRIQRRCDTVLRHLGQPAIGSNAAADSVCTKPTKVLCIFDMQPEQVLEDMVERVWIPAAGFLQQERVADVRIAKNPEEVAAHLSSEWSPEVLFSFAETGWSYDCMAKHKERLLSGDLRWIQSASSGTEKLCPIWDGSPVVCTNMKGEYGSSLAEFVLGCVLHFAKHVPRLQEQKRKRQWQMRAKNNTPPTDIEGKNMLIAGYGGIGFQTAVRAKAFGLHVVAVKRGGASSLTEKDAAVVDSVVAPLPKATFLTALSAADYVVCALPQTSETVILKTKLFIIVADADTSSYNSEGLISWFDIAAPFFWA